VILDASFQHVNGGIVNASDNTITHICKNILLTNVLAFLLNEATKIVLHTYCEVESAKQPLIHKYETICKNLLKQQVVLAFYSLLIPDALFQYVTVCHNRELRMEVTTELHTFENTCYL
jgi:hypothetical protein